MKAKENTFGKKNKWILVIMIGIVFGLITLGEGYEPSSLSECWIYSGTEMRLSSCSLEKDDTMNLTFAITTGWKEAYIEINSLEVKNQIDRSVSLPCRTTPVPSEKVLNGETFDIKVSDCLVKDWNNLRITINSTKVIFNESENLIFQGEVQYSYEEPPMPSFIMPLLMIVGLVVLLIINRYFRRKYEATKLLTIYSKAYVRVLVIFFAVFLLWQLGFDIILPWLIADKIFDFITGAAFIVLLSLSIGLIPMVKEKYSVLKFLLITFGTLIQLKTIL